MVLAEFKRYWKSKINIILFVVALLIIGVALMRDLAERQEFVHHLNNAVNTGDDSEFLNLMVNGFIGTFYFERLFTLNSDYFSIFWIILMTGMGIHLGSKTFHTLQTSYGSMMMARIPYKTYLKKTLLAQFLYMTTFMVAIFSVIFIGMLFIGGGGIQVSTRSTLGTTVENLEYIMPLPQYFMILLGLTLYSIICMIPLPLIASLSPVFLKNKYILQFIPTLILMGGYIIGFTFGNMNDLFRLITMSFIFDAALSSLISLISPWTLFSTTNGMISAIIYVFLYPLMMMTAILILYRINLKKLGADYLL